ncbi:caspase family protein [uncultured Rhodoblastus sp.]|uniref:caspase family protein n=1 Tax=uncultured Rhodoblastus sp. TaxID=543037 RepID=UPI0025E2937A|nr:caspase family protein [uncultured Rhodoblastus sp.]
MKARVNIAVLAVSVLFWALFGVAAYADKRVALIVGNSDYARVIKLGNPENDAHDLADALRGLNFEVIFKINVDQRGLGAALEEFERKAQGADTALFFFAGHGLQFRGQNYLLPVDADLEDEVSLKYNTLAIEKVREALDSASGVKIMILDACRNNPLSDKLVTRTAGLSRSAALTRGLARLDRTEGMVVAYATQADQVAQDGAGRNSPFSSALVRRLKEPNLEIATLFRRVAQDVYEQTGGRQRPELSISLLQDFYLNIHDDDSRQWRRIGPNASEAELRDFIAKFPSSPYVRDAQSRLYVLDTVRQERDAMNQRIAAFEAEKKEFLKREAERLSAEQREKERREKERADADRLAIERQDKERQEAERRQAERVAFEKREQEQLAKARLAAEKLEAERQEAARIATEKLEKERVAAEMREQERLRNAQLAAEKAEKERLAALNLAIERKEKERQIAEERERQRLLAEQRAAEKLEQKRLAEAAREAEKQEAQRLTEQKRETERLEKERARIAALEQEDRKKAEIEAEKLEKDRVAAELREQEKRKSAQLAVEKAEQERLAALSLANERKEKERLATEERERQRLLAAQQAAEKLEQKRLAEAAREAEKQEAQRLAEQKREAERLEKERIKIAALEQENRDKAEMEAAKQRQTEACVRENADFTRLVGEKQPDALQKLKTQVSCPGLVASIDKAVAKLLKAQEQACVAENRALRKIGANDLTALKVFVGGATCDGARKTAGEGVGRLEAEIAKIEAACTSEGERLAAIMAKQSEKDQLYSELTALQAQLLCARLRPTIADALKSFAPKQTPDVDTPDQIKTAQIELGRIGCYSGKIDGALSASTRTALQNYFQAQGKSDGPKGVNDDLLGELKGQPVTVCKEGAIVAKVPEPDQEPNAVRPKRLSPAVEPQREETVKPRRRHPVAREEPDEPAPPRKAHASRPERPQRAAAPHAVVRNHATARPATARPPGPSAASHSHSPGMIGGGY